MKTLENKIEGIILAAIAKLTATTPTPVEMDAGVLHIGNTDMLADNPASLRIALPDNIGCQKSYIVAGFGFRIRGWKPYVDFTFRERGVHTTITLPWGNKPGSYEVVDIPGVFQSYAGYETSFPSPASMEESMQALRRNYVLRDPDKITDMKAVVVEKHATDARTGSVGSFGRPIATLNTMLKGFGLPMFDTQAGNDVLADISAAALGSKVVISWLDRDISRLYSEEGHRQSFPSCMKGCDSEWFEIYDDLQRRGTLRMLLVHNGDDQDDGYHIGRALVWTGENPADSYIDRIYCLPSPTSSDPRPDIVQAIARFCEAEGITKTVFEQTQRLIPTLDKRGLRVKCSTDYSYYPYVDSLRYLYSDGWLSTSSDRGYDMVTLDQTDGSADGAEEPDYNDTLCACGNWYPESETHYSSSRDETYHESYVRFVDSADDYIPRADIVRVYDVWYDKEDDRVTQTSDGVWILVADAVDLDNGNTVHVDNAIILHDDTWVHADRSDELVMLPDGMHALRADCHQKRDEFNENVWVLA